MSSRSSIGGCSVGRESRVRAEAGVDAIAREYNGQVEEVDEE